MLPSIPIFHFKMSFNHLLDSFIVHFLYLIHFCSILNSLQSLESIRIDLNSFYSRCNLFYVKDCRSLTSRSSKLLDSKQSNSAVVESNSQINTATFHLYLLEASVMSDTLKIKHKQSMSRTFKLSCISNSIGHI